MQRKEACGTAEARAEAKGVESVRNGRGGARKKYTDARPLEHDDAVKAINEELKKQDKGHLRIGEIVDGVIGPDGRGDYGKAVVKRLADDPELMCSDEHLYRCLRYYWLMRDHGDALAYEFPKLRFGHLYQIARLLQLEEEHGPEVARDAVRFMAKEAMDKGTDGKPMPTDKLARAVTTHIKSLKGKGRGVGDHGEAQGADENQNDDQNDERDAIKDVMDALGDAIGVVQKAAGRIIESGKYPPQAAGLQMDVDRIGQAHLDLLGLIVRHDPNSMVIPMARRRVVALAKVVGLAVVEPAASEQQEARQ